MRIALGLAGVAAALSVGAAAQTSSKALPGSAAQKAETRHLTAVTSVSQALVTPGSRLSLIVDVVPKARMHVYAPQQKGFIPVSLKLDTDDAFDVHAPEFPKPEKYFFAPLNETQLVYSRPFRIVQDVSIARSDAMRQRARDSGATLTIKGALHYQACDDTVCYLPKDVPLAWTLTLKPVER